MLHLDGAVVAFSAGNLCAIAQRGERDTKPRRSCQSPFGLLGVGAEIETGGCLAMTTSLSVGNAAGLVKESPVRPPRCCLGWRVAAQRHSTTDRGQAAELPTPAGSRLCLGLGGILLGSGTSTAEMQRRPNALRPIFNQRRSLTAGDPSVPMAHTWTRYSGFGRFAGVFMGLSSPLWRACGKPATRRRRDRTPTARNPRCTRRPPSRPIRRGPWLVDDSGLGRGAAVDVGQRDFD